MASDGGGMEGKTGPGTRRCRSIATQRMPAEGVALAVGISHRFANELPTVPLGNIRCRPTNTQ